MNKALVQAGRVFAYLFVSFIITSALMHLPLLSHRTVRIAHAQSVAPSAGENACRSITSGDQGDCQSCFDGGGAYTAIGCLPGNPEEFVTKLITAGMGIGGGIAFLLILFSGFQTMTSAGNPEKLHESKELMGAAISGLLLIIFSIFLLRLIGVTILGIPGFG